ncbi:MAG: hypothetical protein JWL95_3252 [Gemmatimonadetes bacterium]|nr:hypothetical protein [Gemmatimonadota bacterium]
MKEAQAADTKSTNDGDGEAVASTDVARELVLSFGIEVAGLDGLTATSLVDGRLAVRLPPRISPAQAEAAIPVVQALLPYLLDVLKLRGVKVSTGGEHTAGCPNEGKATPSLQIGARVLVLASPGEPRLGGRRATIVARDNTREPIPEGAGSSCPPGRYEWLCDVDDFRPASIAEGPWFRSVDLVAVVE